MTKTLNLPSGKVAILRKGIDLTFLQAQRKAKHLTKFLMH